MRLFLFMALIGLSFEVAQVAKAAGELDNEALVTNAQVQAARDLPQTLVVRVNQSTHEVEVLHTADKLTADPQTQAAIAKKTFEKVDVAALGAPTGELDRDSSRSSWYFCFPGGNWYQPSYYYWGYQYSYSNYYSYNWGGYAYSYYRWNYGWGW